MVAGSRGSDGKGKQFAEANGWISCVCLSVVEGSYALNERPVRRGMRKLFVVAQVS